MSKSKWHEVEFLVPKEKWKKLFVGNSFIGRQNKCRLGVPDDKALVSISGRVDPAVLAALAEFVLAWCAEEKG